MTRLWIFMTKWSQELVPSPLGDLRVVMLSFLVGMRTGPLVLKPSWCAFWIRFEQAASRGFTKRDLKVMLMGQTVTHRTRRISS